MDTDQERLPDGMTRVGYDADTQVYTFKDAYGSYWESAPGCEYGQLTRAGDGASNDVEIEASNAFLAHSDANLKTSWRQDLMPLLNFGLIIGLSLLLLFWYFRWSASTAVQSAATCPEDARRWKVKAGDTCWSLGEANGITVDNILMQNPGLDCSRLLAGSIICLPASGG